MFFAARTSLGFMTTRERVIYYTLVVARALVGFLDIFGILLVGVVASLGVTQFNPGGAPSTLLGFELPALDGQGMLTLVVFTLAVFVVKAIIAISLSRALTRFIASIEGRNANELADHLLRGSLERAKRLSKAEFQYAITESTMWSFTGVLNNVASIVSETFLLIIIAVAFFIVDPIVAVFAIVYFAAIVFGMQAFIGRMLKRAGNDAADGTVDTINAVSDTLDTFREISVLAKQDLFLGRIHTSRMRLAHSGSTLQFLAGMPRYVVETALILGVVIFVGQQLLTGELATGLATLGIFLAGAVRIMGSILPLQTAVAALKINVERAQLAQGLLAEVRDDARLAATLPSSQTAVVDVTMPLAVSIVDADYTYSGDEHTTLTGIELTIEAGSYSAIIGPSGAGKTTIVDVILGLIRPQEGKVEIGGVEPNALRAIAPGLVSYVPQKPGLVSGTIAENIALGVDPSAIDHDLLAEVVHSAYLSEFIASLPDGLNTSVGKQADALSGGQIQRIGLARALYVRPKLLILDEATSGLDAGSEAVVGDSLRALHGAVTVIVIAHRLSTVQHADVVHVVEGGRIVASGDFPTVKRTVPMVAEYVKLMSFEADTPPTGGSVAQTTTAEVKDDGLA